MSNDPQAVDQVKIVQSGLNSLREYGRQTPPQFDAAELRAAVAAARRRGCRVMVHANGRDPVRLAVEAGCDSIEHGFFMGTGNLARMADRGTIWVPTAVTMAAYAENRDLLDARQRAVCLRNLDHQLEQLRMARDLGVTVAAGSDAGSPGVLHGRSLGWEIGLLVQAGYSLEEAIGCATRNGARLLGLETPGIIDAGAPATFVAVSGSPGRMSDSLGRPAGLMVEGAVVSGFFGGAGRVVV